MKWIYELEDIEKLEGTVPMETLGYLREKFYNLQKVYQDDGTHFSLGEYGGIALVESYDEIETLIFEENFPESYQGIDFFRCVYVPDNETCIDYCVPVSILSADQFRELLDNASIPPVEGRKEEYCHE